MKIIFEVYIYIIYIYCHKNVETKSSNFVTCGQVLTVKESMVDTCLPVSQALP